MKKKNIFPIIAAIFLVILIVYLAFFQEKSLDITSEKITSLYNNLGEVDINKCGGLITYSNETITKANLEDKNLLCRAYYNLDESKKTNEITKSNSKSDNGINICKVGESVTLTTNNEDETECSYQIIDKEDLTESYTNLYGSKSTDIDSFYISDKEACFKEGEKYYCGYAENYNISIAPETTIYRIINKAIEKSNKEIVIYDYFLKISNNICYSKNSNEENKDCSNALNNTDLNSEEEIISLVKKYGAIYKHTFKNAENKNNYYWIKSELK